jgi:hypothetical protein
MSIQNVSFIFCRGDAGIATAPFSKAGDTVVSVNAINLTDNSVPGQDLSSSFASTITADGQITQLGGISGSVSVTAMALLARGN